MTKLETAERYSWYILNAMEHHIAELKKVIKEGNEALKAEPDSPKILRNSLEGTIAHCEWSLREHSEALKALREVGWN
jgi:hypothetical protein